MSNYIVKCSWYNISELLGEYKTISKEIHENISVFVSKFIDQNNKTKKFDDISFLITPENWYNTMVLSWCYFNNKKVVLLIDKLKDINNILEIKEILKNEYVYNDKQIELFEKIYNRLKENNNIEIINKEISYNLLSVLWFWNEDNCKNEILESHSKKIPVYDMYELSNFNVKEIL